MATVDVVLERRGGVASSVLGRNLALALLVAVLLFLTAYPMAMLVYGSLHTTPPGEAGTFNLDGYRTMLSRTNAIVLLIYANLGFVTVVGGLEARITPEARAFTRVKLLGTTDYKLQEEMLKTAKQIYK
jgi:uncharacterized membrane protein YedE/YeeE